MRIAGDAVSVRIGCTLGLALGLGAALSAASASAASPEPAVCQVIRSGEKTLALATNTVVGGRKIAVTIDVHSERDGARMVVTRRAGCGDLIYTYARELLETKQDDGGQGVGSTTTYSALPPPGWLKPGSSFETEATTTFVAGREADRQTTTSRSHQRFQVTGMGAVSISGCSYPVLAIHIASSPPQGEAGTASESDIKYSPELHATLMSSSRNIVDHKVIAVTSTTVSIAVVDPAP
ncbi:MAG: hypothetical protein P4L98_23325 [Ancalomicrobiaceae bacterium]|nr:hypothetical protein [Ancalomicrobiaceae bacterium]